MNKKKQSKKKSIVKPNITHTKNQYNKSIWTTTSQVKTQHALVTQLFITSLQNVNGLQLEYLFRKMNDILSDADCKQSSYPKWPKIN